MATIDLHRLRQLNALLERLLACDADEREAQLARLRSDDPALASEVGALLAQRSVLERRGFFDGCALDNVGVLTLGGRTLGAYTLERLLGTGGMGSVWLARRSDGRFDAVIAIKLLNPALAARGGAERFAREGTLLGRLAHPNIARLLDAGVADGQPYLVLEYVDGEPIDRWCDARELPIDARVRLVLDVLGAVGHAHANLVLHRDLKPSNILVTRDGQVKLLDFGIAKLLADEALPAEATELTQQAGRAFTLDYAAPEQVQGGPVTTATDVYALGVLLYVLLAGVHPTAKPATTPFERMRSLIETEPRRVSDAAADAKAKHARALRGDLDNIVAKALHKAPQQRYAGAAALADDLRRYLGHEPVSARADSFAYRSVKFLRRHRLAVGAASVMLVLLVGGVVGTAWQAVEARRERDEALFQAERALAKGSVFNLLLGSLGDDNRPLTQREILDRGVQLIDKQFGGEPRIAIDLLLPIAGQYGLLGDIERDLAVMRRAAELAAATGDAQEIAHVACGTVGTELARGRIDQARQQLQSGLAALALVPQPRFAVAAECLRAEADLARAEGDLDRAIDRAAAAVGLAEQRNQTRGNVYPALLGQLATLHRHNGDVAAAYALSKRLQQLYETRGQTDSLDFVGARFNEAFALLAWGEVRGAQLIVDALVARWHDAATAPIWLVTLRGLLSHRLGDVERARRELREAIERHRAGGNAQPDWSDLVLANMAVDLGELDAAQRVLASAELASLRSGGEHRSVSPATVAARLHLARGSLAEARAVIEGELARLKRPRPLPSVALVAALKVAARVEVTAGDAPRALRAAHDAVEAAERIARDPARSADVGEALLLLAQAQRLAGDSGADATAQRAARALAGGLGDDHRLTRDALGMAAR